MQLGGGRGWSTLYEVNGFRVDRTGGKATRQNSVSFIHVGISVDLSSKEHTILCTMIMCDPGRVYHTGARDSYKSQEGFSLKLRKFHSERLISLNPM